MNVVMFIDYANLFHNFQNIFDCDNQLFIENKICECVIKTCEYLKVQGIHIAGKKAYVLPDEIYGKPKKNLWDRANILVEYVAEPMRRKTASMKQMVQSRADDKELARGVLTCLKDERLQGIMIVSNDNDFANVGEQVKYCGKDFFVGSIEAKCKRKGKHVRTGNLIKSVSNKTIPMFDILEQKDEGDYFDTPERMIAEELELSKESGPRLELYKNQNLILNYPINKNMIQIGRRSIRRHHLPHIDLTAFDKEKVVSRQHAEILKIGEKLIFSIHQNCSRGTWIGRKAASAGEQFVLQPDQPILLGDRTEGFVMVYRNK